MAHLIYTSLINSTLFHIHLLLHLNSSALSVRLIFIYPSILFFLTCLTLVCSCLFSYYSLTCNYPSILFFLTCPTCSTLVLCNELFVTCFTWPAHHTYNLFFMTSLTCPTPIYSPIPHLSYLCNSLSPSCFISGINYLSTFTYTHYTPHLPYLWISLSSPLLTSTWLTCPTNFQVSVVIDALYSFFIFYPICSLFNSLTLLASPVQMDSILPRPICYLPNSLILPTSPVQPKIFTVSVFHTTLSFLINVHLNLLLHTCSTSMYTFSTHKAACTTCLLVFKLPNLYLTEFTTASWPFVHLLQLSVSPVRCFLCFTYTHFLICLTAPSCITCAAPDSHSPPVPYLYN